MSSRRVGRQEPDQPKRIGFGTLLGRAALLGLVLLLFVPMAWDGVANGRLHRQADLADRELFVIEGFEDVARLIGRTRVLAFGHIVSTGEELSEGVALSMEERGSQAGDTVPGYLIQAQDGRRFVTEGKIRGLEPVWHVGPLYFNFLFLFAAGSMAFFLWLGYMMLFVDLDEVGG